MLKFGDLSSADGDTIDRDYLNKRWALLAGTIAKLQNQSDAISALANNLIQVVLTRVDTVLTPLLVRVQAASQLGFLNETSASTLNMAVNVDVNVQIDDNDARGLFAPTAFLAIVDNSDINNWSTAQLLSWNAATGLLGIKPLYIHGSGSGSNWTVSASGAVMPTIISTLETIATDASETTDAKNAALAALALAETAVAEAQAAAELADQWNPTSYSTTVDMNAAIAAAIAAALSTYPHTAQMNAAITTALGGYATQTWANAAIASALSPYETTSAINTAIAAALASYETTTAINAAIASALTSYETTSAVNAAIAAALNGGTF